MTACVICHMLRHKAGRRPERIRPKLNESMTHLIMKGNLIMSLREIIENHLSAEELNRVDLSEINLTHGIDFHNSNSNTSLIALGSWYGRLKPLNGDSVRIMTENHIIDTLTGLNEEERDYFISLKEEDTEFFICIEFSW